MRESSFQGPRLPLDELLRRIGDLSGAQLLEEIVNFAAFYLDEHHNSDPVGQAGIVRALVDRLAATGIAERHDTGTRWTWPQGGRS